MSVSKEQFKELMVIATLANKKLNVTYISPHALRCTFYIDYAKIYRYYSRKVDEDYMLSPVVKIEKAWLSD